MEDQVKLLGIILILSGSANILLSILLYMNNREWLERYLAQADRHRRMIEDMRSGRPEPPKPQEITR